MVVKWRYGKKGRITGSTVKNGDTTGRYGRIGGTTGSNVKMCNN